MWLAIFGAILLFAIAGAVYIVCGFHRFSPIKKLAEKHGFLAWLLSAVIAAAVCAVIAWIVSGTGSAKDLDSMKTVLTAFTAGDHLINDTLSVSNVGDLFIRSEQNRSYSPPVSSSGGRSGSHSSHSGSYSGHSGTSHSGSGRKF